MTTRDHFIAENPDGSWEVWRDDGEPHPSFVAGGMGKDAAKRVAAALDFVAEAPVGAPDPKWEVKRLSELADSTLKRENAEKVHERDWPGHDGEPTLAAAEFYNPFSRRDLRRTLAMADSLHRMRTQRLLDRRAFARLDGMARAVRRPIELYGSVEGISTGTAVLDCQCALRYDKGLTVMHRLAAPFFISVHVDAEALPEGADFVRMTLAEPNGFADRPEARVSWRSLGSAGSVETQAEYMDVVALREASE